MGSENVKMGVCSVVYDGSDLGLTKGGTEFVYTPEYHTITVDQFGNTPINEYLIGEKAEAKVILAESTLARIKAFCPTATQVIDGAKTKLTFGSKPGLELLSRAKKLVLHPISMGADVSLDVSLYKAAIKSELKLSYKLDGEYLYEVTFAALVDETKSAGNYLFCVGDESAALDLVAPTMSIVPANNAAAVDKSITTTVQMTFTKDMDPSTINKNNIHVFADVAGTEVAGVLSYDVANKRAIFTPSGAWGANTVYRVYVGTGVKSVNGISMAAPSINKFTTGA